MIGKALGCLVAAISVPISYVVQVNYCKQITKHEKQISEQFLDQSNNDYEENDCFNKFQSDNSNKFLGISKDTWPRVIEVLCDVGVGVICGVMWGSTFIGIVGATLCEIFWTFVTK